jgi:hypothetical protein
VPDPRVVARGFTSDLVTTRTLDAVLSGGAEVAAAAS